jgi:ERCC4-related helicase
MEKIHAHHVFRGIVFVKQRVMTHVLKHVIEGHEILQHQTRIGVLYSTKTAATASLGITRSQLDKGLKAFSTGRSNSLITTSVAEEGLDVPSANCVLYFDPMDHAVSYVQGRGRARQAYSSFVMLNERSDGSAALLARQEMEQHAVAASLSGSRNMSLQQHEVAERQDQQAATTREFRCHLSEWGEA